MRKIALALALAPSLALAVPAAAQEFVAGIGYVDYHAQDAETGGFVSGDYLAARDWSLVGFDWGLGVTAQLHEAGDVFFGAGVQGQRDFANGWFIEASLMPGLYDEGKEGNDLGSAFEIRSLVGVGRELRNGNRLSLAVSHISNASTGDSNPGLNAISLRFHVPFGG